MATGAKRPAKKAAETPAQTERGSGNVFADLNLSNPDLALLKAKLVQRVRELIAERMHTQAQAARLLGLDQAKVAALVRGRVQGYSIDRLVRFLHALGQEVEISVGPAKAANEDQGIVVKRCGEFDDPRGGL